jgi:hypothetical protein
MSPACTLILLSAALLVGACSDSRAPTAPTESSPDLLRDAIIKPLQGFWTGSGTATPAPQGGVTEMHSPLLCNFGGTGPECMRVFHSGTFVDHVYHRGRAQGTGCSRSIIRIGGVLRGRSGFRCHHRGDILTFTWIVQEFHPFGTRIQVDYSGAGAASPTGYVFTNYR